MNKKIKGLIKSRLPFLGILRGEISLLPLRIQKPEIIFTKIYFQKKWGDPESLSGSGSSLLQTETIRETLPI